MSLEEPFQTCEEPTDSMLETESFVKKVQKLCDSVGIRLTDQSESDTRKLHLEFAPNFPMRMVIELPHEIDSALFYGVVRTYGLPGDRSDYHDFISSIWAIGLRCVDCASVRLVDIPHPIVEGELYGRYLFFDTQPAIGFISIKTPDLEKVEEILWNSRRCAMLFSDLFLALGGDHDQEEYDGAGELAWASTVAKVLGLKLSFQKTLYNSRIKPDWSYYRRNDKGISAFKFDTAIIPFFPQTIFEESKTVEGVSGVLFISEKFQNVLPNDVFKTLSKLLKAYQQKLPKDLKVITDTMIVPIESHIFVITESGIVAIEGDCGLRAFLEEKSALRFKYQEISKFLHSAIEFEWNTKLDDEKFELLILELLQRERGVEWVRKVGHSSAADGERDIVAEWYLGPAPWQEANPQEPIVKRRVIVQCKAYRDPINLSKIPNVPVILDFHNANGYLLVAFPRITPQVVDYFKTVPVRQKFWSDWWTKSEIEERLRSNLDIARRYTELFRVTGEDIA